LGVTRYFMGAFVKNKDILWVLSKKIKIMGLTRKTLDYFAILSKLL